MNCSSNEISFPCFIHLGMSVSCLNWRGDIVYWWWLFWFEFWWLTEGKRTHKSSQIWDIHRWFSENCIIISEPFIWTAVFHHVITFGFPIFRDEYDRKRPGSPKVCYNIPFSSLIYTISCSATTLVRLKSSKSKSEIKPKILSVWRLSEMNSMARWN